MKKIGKKLRLFFSLLLNARAIRNRIFVFRPTLLDISKRATIRVKRKLYFNKQWVEARQLKNKSPGCLCLESGATLTADSFTCHAGCRVIVHKGAVLTLKTGFLNNESVINCTNSICIGEDCAISERVVIRDSNVHKLLDEGYSVSAPIEIGDHVWIGMNATILPGVTIGDGAVIAAGAVVSQDVPPKALAAGVPARVIRENVEWEK